MSERPKPLVLDGPPANEDEEPLKQSTLTDESFEALLKEQGAEREVSPYRLEAIDPAIFEVSGVVSHDNAELMPALLSMIKTYLEAPIVTDHFMSHPLRRAWRGRMDTLYENFSERYKSNRLSLNMMTEAHQAITILVGWGFSWDKFPEYKEVFYAIPKERYFDALPTDEKKEHIQHISELMFDFYQHLGRQATALAAEAK